MASAIPAEVRRSLEWQQRCEPRPGFPTWKNHTPVFEAPRKAVVVVDVTKAWAGKPMRILSIGPSKHRTSFTIGESTGSATNPVVCFRTGEAACRAPQEWTTSLPRNTTRQLLLLEIGTAGCGTTGIMAGKNGALLANTARAVGLAPLPSKYASKAQPAPPFWLPGIGSPEAAKPEFVVEAGSADGEGMAPAPAPAASPEPGAVATDA